MKPAILNRLKSTRELGIGAVLALVVIVISIRSPVFLAIDNLHDIAVDVSILAIMAVGMMMVFVTGGIDISVAGNLAFSGMVVAMVVAANWNVPPFVAVIIGVAFGAMLGAVNGLLVVGARVNPIIATLGTMSIFRGLTFIVNFFSEQGTWISADRFPASFKAFARATTLWIPNLIFIAIIVYVLAYFVMNHTRFGRNVFAVGSNTAGAGFVGINVKRVTFLVYMLNGALAGLGGVMWVSRFTSAQTDSAMGFEFTVITAAVLGGTKITGGSGSVIGVLLGAVLIGVINNALNLARINPFWELAINGFIVLMAVVVDKAVADRNEQRALERRKI